MELEVLLRMKLGEKKIIETGLEGLEILRVFHDWVYKFSYYKHDQDTPYLVVPCFVPERLYCEALNNFS